MTSTQLDHQLDAITERALNGDIEGAVEELRAALRADPESGAAWLTLAMVLSSAARWPEAHHAFGQATALGVESPAAYRSWARALEHLSRLGDAAEALRRAHELAPADAAPLHDLGAVLYRLGDYDAALDTLRRAEARSPASARIAYTLGLCHEARRNPASAIAAYERAVGLDPRFTPARKTLADLLATLGEHEQAIAVLDDLLRIERTNEQAAHNRDVLAHALGKMRAQRLLGKGEREWDLSALVHEGELQKRERRSLDGEAGSIVRYANALVEVHTAFDHSGRAQQGTLMLIDAGRAARKRDKTFRVTVVGAGGKNEPADYATAISLTFLREGLGVPMTQASHIYARALAREDGVTAGGASVAFATLTSENLAASRPRADAHGLTIALSRLAGAKASMPLP